MYSTDALSCIYSTDTGTLGSSLVMKDMEVTLADDLTDELEFNTTYINTTGKCVMFHYQFLGRNVGAISVTGEHKTC